MVVEVEIAAVRRDPREAPAHALLVCADLAERRARHRGECHVTMLEMDRDTIEIVGPERAGRAALVPIWTEHEMINDQLGALLEEVDERYDSIWPLEPVRLLHPFPRHRHAAARQRIA